jgi:2-isopropylmalate synthase
VADRKKEITTQDIQSIVEIEVSKVPETYTIHSLQIMSGNTMVPLASVTLIKEGEQLTDAATGNGPVDAVFNGIERITGVHGKLRDYDLKAVTMGRDALGEAMVRVEIGQAVTHTGSMEIADIAMGMWGVLAFGAVYTLVHYFRKALRKRKGETR